MSAPEVPRIRRPLHPTQLLALGFGGLILLGTLALWIPPATAPGQATSFLTAFFTATSAVCVTGLVVVHTSTHWSMFGQVVLTVLMQMGGLGVMTISAVIYVLLGLRIRFGQRLALQEGLNVESLAGVVRLALQILVVALAFELVGAALLTLGFWPRYHAHAVFMGIFHAVSAFNNAGFDITGSSLMGYAGNPLVLLTHAFLIVFGGLGYAIILDLALHLTKRRREWTLHARWVLLVTAILLVAGTALFLVFEWQNPATLGHMTVGNKILNAFFQSVTARTAGFNSVPMAALAPTSVILLLLLMYIGASPGGSGGGIKTTTFAVIVAGVIAVIRQRPEAQAYGRRLSWPFFARAVAIAMLALTMIVVITTGILLTNHTQFIDALFETVSAFGTVGLSLGLTPHLTPIGRVLIIITMYLGRIGPLTAALALARPNQLAPTVRYPEARLPIG